MNNNNVYFGWTFLNTVFAFSLLGQPKIGEVCLKKELSLVFLSCLLWSQTAKNLPDKPLSVDQDYYSLLRLPKDVTQL